MPTVSELGRKVKAQNPGLYDHYTDEEFGRKLKAKYPYYSHYDDPGAAMVPVTPVTPVVLTPRAEEIIYRESTYPPRPKAPAHKSSLYIVGVTCFVLAVTLFMVGNFIFALALVVGGVFLVKAGATADQRERDNMLARAQTKQYEVQHEVSVTDLESARQDAWMRTQLKNTAMQTSLMREQLAQHELTERLRESIVRTQLISTAERNGVTVDDVIRLNNQQMQDELEIEKKRRLNELDNQKEWEEIQTTLRGVRQQNLTGNQQVKELYDDLEQKVDKLVSVKNSKKPKYAKQMLTGSLISQITSIRTQIDEIQAKLVQGGNRQNTGGATSGTAKSRAAHTP